MIVEVVEGIMNLIKENIIAKNNVTSDVLTGEVIIHVEDSFHFNNGEEIILIDYGYNDETSPHYQTYEYAKIKTVDDTRTITLQSPAISNWLVSNGAFIQKTIGHSPLYDDRVYYGDREVIPTEDMAVTVEPVSMSNEWMYIQGGLSQEYRLSIIIYGKDIETEQGLKILNMYGDAIYQLLMSSIHTDLNNYDTALLSNVAAGTNTVIVADTSENREKFVITPIRHNYEIQDNQNVEIDLILLNVTTPGDGKMYLEVSRTYPPDAHMNLLYSYTLSEFAVFRKRGIYLYDSRPDNVEYATTQKGSAFIRAARINWFGKEVQEFYFPQKSKAVIAHGQDTEISSSSES